VMDADDPEDVRSTQALVVDELERMTSLVQELGAAAALHGPSPIAVQQIDAGELVHQIVRKAQSIDGATVSTGPVADVVAAMDPGRITQALLQLAQNAVTHGDGVIDIGSRVHDGALELWVRDHGPGVPDGDKSAIFDRFHRSDAGGSGLGLNIVQVIARAHGGTVRVEDAQGGGALFVLSLPLAPGVIDLPLDLVIPPKPPLPALAESTRGA
jgi:signal transduction histidine kinase